LIIKFRKRINHIDSQILALLEKRLSLTNELLDYKAKNDIKIEDHDRETEIIDRLTSEVSEEYKKQISRIVIGNIWNSIFTMTKKRIWLGDLYHSRKAK